MIKCCICNKFPEEDYRMKDMNTGLIIDRNLYFYQNNYFCSPYCSLIFFSKIYNNDVETISSIKKIKNGQELT